MRINNLLKYFLRFLLLQTTLTQLTIWYFDKFLIGNYLDGYNIIIKNLLEDRIRFYDFIPYDFVKIDIYLASFIFIFLLIIYSSNFYTYTNELSLTVNKDFFDEFFPIYLIWTTSFLSFLQIFRFTAVSRGYLLIYTFLVPLVLITFRNTEVLSSILGRNPSKENYLTFNLDSNSIYRELRLLKFRNNLRDFKNINDFNEIIKEIDHENKLNEINLVVLDLKDISSIPKELENYLIQLNKKILLITRLDFEFNSLLLFRSERIGNTSLIYLNNDIQYGARYILKRTLDLFLTLLISPILIIIFFVSNIYILITSGYPSIIRQKRIGLHGKEFYMFKLRTMKKNSHNSRTELKTMNQKTGPLFKIEDDPRFINGAKTIRKFSIDEIPQFFNVIKGEMSIVGPRPLFPEDNQYFDVVYMRRLNVLPGITGLLQINDRNTPNFETWFEYDIEYIENWSIWLDLKIILKTPFSIFKKKVAGQ